MTVEHDSATQQFTIRLDDGVGYLKYRRMRDGAIDMQTTWVPPSARGRGVGAMLVEAAMRYAQAEGAKVVPSCWYVDEWIDLHPEYRTLRA
jgi:predicted GNAT family acetyltransferase